MENNSENFSEEEEALIARSLEAVEDSLETGEFSGTSGVQPIRKKMRSPFGTESGLFKFLIIFGIALVFSSFIFQVWLTPILVVGTSMQPTINAYVTSESDQNHNDVVYYAKSSAYSVGDIVIVDNTSLAYIDLSNIAGYEDEENPNYLIKRIVACGGQTIRFYLTDTNKTIHQTIYYFDITVLNENGADINLDQSFSSETMYFTALQYEYYSRYYPTYAEIFGGLLTDTDGDGIEDGIYEYKVSEGYYFVMGDNRNNSTDSRYFGEVAYDDICGSVRLIVAYGQNIFTAIIYKIRYGSY